MSTDPTVSVSRGVFVSRGSSQNNKQKNRNKFTLFEHCFTVEPWYLAFKDNWSMIETNIKNLSMRTYNSVLSEMVSYIRECYDSLETDAFDSLIPGATLLTGVNQPDHLVQFTALREKIRCEATPHIATVNSEDAPTVRHLVESAVYQLMHCEKNEQNGNFDADDSFDSPTKKGKIRKSNCNFMALRNWYKEMYDGKIKNGLSPKKKMRTLDSPKPLVIIIPDFESFNCEVLQDFVTIASSYTRSLPIILVFGVATSVSALHKSFPYHVSSKLLIKVFQSHSSASYLNEVLEEVFLTPSCPFHLSGRAFELFTDVFLFYDFSVTGFTRSIKYCMMDHFYGDNIKSLCCEKSKIPTAISKLTSEDFDVIRHLPSFRTFVESRHYNERISLLEEDEYLKRQLHQCLNAFHEYLVNFHLTLKLLHVFVKDLPKHLLGQQVRELYVKCTSEMLTSTTEFKECMQLLKFHSKPQLLEKITNCLKTISSVRNNNPHKSSKSLPLSNSPLKGNKTVKIIEKKTDTSMDHVRVELNLFLSQVDNASLESEAINCFENDSECDLENLPMSINRLKLKESLLKATKVERMQSEFEMIRSRLIDYLKDLFAQYLVPPSKLPFYEIFLFDEVANVKKQIVGAPRGAIHTALNNPVAYLQCTCCELPTVGSISSSLPDASVAYKLHLECGKLINLYDWLQAFAAVVDPTQQDEERRDIPKNIQSRFSRAVAEIQFLGFIKASKRKTDHVTRLTW